ncbi:MAG: cupin domain-containing protein [Candidatus Marinimicrobia bacterium]|nr:cupin domain-containing protein [Candidatus Neomarinimicrobiota bacterium]
MDELDKGLGLNITVTGAARDAALEAFHRQLADWGLAMPPVEPLVLDFGLGAFAETGLIEYWVANEAQAGYCGKFLFVFDGQTCPRHRHALKHETFFVVKGRVRMQTGARTFEMQAGDVLPVAPGHFHRFTGLGPALLLELSTPCQIADNDFENPAIPINRSVEPEKGAGRSKSERERPGLGRNRLDRPAKCFQFTLLLRQLALAFCH